MSTTSRVRLSCGLLAVSFISLILPGCGGGGGGSTTAPTLHPPSISQFEATPADIAPGDSLQLTYTVTGADSTVLTPPYVHLANVSAGAVYVKPAHPVRYLLLAYNKDGHDSASLVVAMASSVPSLSASIDADTIVQKDSAFITYQALRADSVTLTGSGKLASASSGRARVAPMINANYLLIAYNSVGTDTSKFSVSVEIPQRLAAVNGLFYKGTLGSAITTPALKFVCTGEQTDTLRKVWVHFVKQDGDGQLSADSVRPDNTGIASVSYDFNGTSGHAEILAFVRNAPAASAYVRIRANALTPGPLGQIQFGLISDSVATVKDFDPNPVVYRDSRPDVPIVYLSYETSAGVVFYVFDHNNDFKAEDSEEVFGGAVFAPYAQKTKEGIGIGSSYSDVRAAYGAPNDFGYDSTRVEYAASYNAMGAAFLFKPSDTTVEQIQFGYNTTRPVPGLRPPAAATALEQADRSLHLMYFPPN